jgi:hypothetical protein
MFFLPQKPICEFPVPSNLANTVHTHLVLRIPGRLRFSKELYHGFVKHRDIIQTPAANPISIPDSLLVFPIATRVANIILDRVIARKLTPFSKAS